MSKAFAIQIMFILWSLYQSDIVYTQASVVGYSFFSSLELVMCTAVGLQVAHSRIVYVIPNATAPCPKNSDSSCHTLSWYSHKGSERLMSNDTVVILLKGSHSLNSTIYIDNGKNLTIRGDLEHMLSLAGAKHQTPHPVSSINCTSLETGIVFEISRS